MSVNSNNFISNCARGVIHESNFGASGFSPKKVYVVGTVMGILTGVYLWNTLFSKAPKVTTPPNSPTAGKIARQFKEKILSLRQYCNELEGQNVTLEKQLSEAKSELGRVTEQFSKEGEETQAFQAEVLKNLNSTIKQLSKQLSDVKGQLNSVLVDNSLLEKEFNLARDSYRLSQIRNADLNKEVETLTDGLSTKKGEITLLQNENNRLLAREDLFRKTEKELNSAKDSIQKLQKDNQFLQEQFDSMYDDYYKRVHAEKKLSALNAQIESLKSDVSELNKENKSLTAEKNSLLEVSEHVVKTLKKENDSLKEENERLRALVESLTSGKA